MSSCIGRLEATWFEARSNPKASSVTRANHPIAGTQTPWLYTSRLTGPVKLTVQVSDGGSAQYTVILHFVETEALSLPDSGSLTCGSKARTLPPDSTSLAVAGDTDRAWSRQYRDVATERTLTLDSSLSKASRP